MSDETLTQARNHQDGDRAQDERRKSAIYDDRHKGSEKSANRQIDQKKYCLDLDAVKEWYKIFCTPGRPVEVRAIGYKTYSGYFDNIDTLLKQLPRYQDEALYFTINEVKPACMSRRQSNKFVSDKKMSTTSDNDIEWRLWLFIDIDPDKPSDTNATNKEKEVAREVAHSAWKILRESGFSEPVVIDSANGYHLYYRIEMPNDSETLALIKRFYNELNEKVGRVDAKIDAVVSNAARIAKLPGSWSKKGADTADRPQRQAKILYVPDMIKTTSRECIEAFAGVAPETDTGRHEVARKKDGDFNAHAFVRTHLDISHENRKMGPFGPETVYHLASCPFDESHTSGSACVFVSDDGPIVFKCQHNSCKDKTWSDVRLLYEPDAYDWKHDERKRQTATQTFTESTGRELADDIQAIGDERANKNGKNDFDAVMLDSIPLWGLSKKNQALVKAVAKGYHSHTDYALVGMFAAAATMLGARCSTQIENYHNFGNIWIASVGLVSAKKSGPLKWFMKAVEKKDTEEDQEYAAKKRHWELTIKEKGKENTPPPKHVHHLENNTTDEQMLEALCLNDAIMWYVDELAVAFASMGRYTKNGGAIVMENNMLSIFGYGRIKITRKSQDPLSRDVPCLSICGTIQPDVIAEIMGKRKRDGLFQRFIYVYPDIVEDDDYKKAEQFSNEVEQWEDEVRRLSEMNFPNMCVTPEAQDVYLYAKRKWQKAINQYAKTDPMLASLIDKKGYHLCRWAIVASALSDTPGTIGGDIMRYSFECCEVFINYGTKVLRLFQDEPKQKEPKRMTQKALFTELFSRFQVNPTELARVLSVSEELMRKYNREAKQGSAI